MKRDEALLYALRLYRIDVCIFRPEVYQEMVKLVLNDRFFESVRRVQVQISR